MRTTKKILVIEDHPEIRSLLESLLLMEGYVVSSAGNGQEGLLALEKSSADLIILDLLMPVMNGIQFLEELREGRAAADPKTPVIVLSATEEVLSETWNGAPQKVISKPFKSDELMGAIYEALNLSS